MRASVKGATGARIDGRVAGRVQNLAAFDRDSYDT